MPRLIYAPAALDDLESIQRYLSQPGAGARAGRRWAAIRNALSALKTEPTLWAVGDHPGVRERPVEGHRIMYEIRGTRGDVVILRVYGPRQDRRGFAPEPV